MAVIPAIPPGSNSTFRQPFFGPTIQCSVANSSQQVALDYYSNALLPFGGTYDQTVILSTFKAGNLTWTGEENVTTTPADAIGSDAPYMLLFSAFAPFAGSNLWFYALNQFLPSFTMG